MFKKKKEEFLFVVKKSKNLFFSAIVFYERLTGHVKKEFNA